MQHAHRLKLDAAKYNRYERNKSYVIALQTSQAPDAPCILHTHRSQHFHPPFQGAAIALATSPFHATHPTCIQISLIGL